MNSDIIYSCNTFFLDKLVDELSVISIEFNHTLTFFFHYSSVAV